MSVQGNPINVFAYSEHFDYWRCAKNAVFGAGSFIRGKQYKDFQDLLNSNIRSGADEDGVPLLRWSDDAPDKYKRIDIRARTAYNREHQPYLMLTPRGEGKLSRVLGDFYGKMQDPWKTSRS